MKPALGDQPTGLLSFMRARTGRETFLRGNAPRPAFFKAGVALSGGGAGFSFGGKP